MILEVGKEYKWKHDNVILTFMGKKGGWNQFCLHDKYEVWCEVLDSDLYMMEEVQC